MDRSSDQYALGALVLGSVLLTCSFWDLEPSSLWRFVRELQRDVPLPDGLVETVHLLVGDGSQSRGTTTSASQLVGRISSDLSWAPAPHSGDISRPQGLTPAREVDRTLAGLVSYIDGTARLDRTDSLFPADPAVFETNPLSVAYGAAGVVHALHSLGQPINRRYIDWITNRPITNGAYPPGLYLGSAGIAWVLAEVGEGDRACEIMRTARQSPLLWSRPDVMHGAAGYGMACLKMSAMGLGQRFAEEAIEVGEFLVGSAQRNASGHYWPNSNGVAPVGYAYGASGIALFLLYLSAVVSDSSFQDIGRSALGHDLNHAIWLNETLLGFPSEAASDVEVDSLPLVARCYWEAGSAGVLTSVVRYAHMMSDPDLEAWIPHLVADSSHKYAVFPQLFHGLAGLGYALLDVWEFRSDPDALDRARRVAEGVRLFAMERPEGVAFPGEQARRESADYATGAAGVALFLHRLGGADSGDCSNHNFVVDELLPPRRAIKHGSG